MRLEHEGGTHRVQRVPVTEAKGRMHTSTATVTVLPEADGGRGRHRPQRPQDRRLPLDGSGRAVGQHHGLRRAHHAPADRHGRGDAGREEPDPEPGQGHGGAAVAAAQGRAGPPGGRDVGPAPGPGRGGSRTDKIRTYNFKENRVTDHRINLTLYKLDQVLAGDLDELTDALMADKRARQLAGEEDGGR